jgi:nicotinate-nucleotide pyrophosphorylase (carboxylating)
LVAREVFLRAAPGCRVRILISDGSKVHRGQTVMKIEGGPSILTAERTALNFLQHLSGIATLTAAFTSRLCGTKAKIFDTRKTIPGLRELAKYAVVCGGGHNHRLGLYDAVLLKDNHWPFAQPLGEAVRSVRRKHPGIAVEIEAKSFTQIRRAIAARADIILLDNMTVPRLRQATALIRSRASAPKIEISGGVNLKNVRSLAKLNPDRISVGCLTHSAPALDLSLEI